MHAPGVRAAQALASSAFVVVSAAATHMCASFGQSARNREVDGADDVAGAVAGGGADTHARNVQRKRRAERRLTRAPKEGRVGVEYQIAEVERVRSSGM